MCRGWRGIRAFIWFGVGEASGSVIRRVRVGVGEVAFVLLYLVLEVMAVATRGSCLIAAPRRGDGDVDRRRRFVRDGFPLRLLYG